MSWIPSYKKPSSGGGGYIPCSWSDGTDEEIVEALEAHYNGDCDLHEYWSVGDERNIQLSAIPSTTYNLTTLESHIAQRITMVILNKGGKTLADGITECAFIVGQKDVLTGEYDYEYGQMYSFWTGSARREWCNDAYRNAFPSSIKNIFLQYQNETALYNQLYTTNDYFAFPAEYEIFGSRNYSYSVEEALPYFEYFQTSANRIKYITTYQHTAKPWMGRSINGNNNSYMCGVNINGVSNSFSFTSNLGIAPFGVI